jgi:hypothetical protein
VREVQAHLRVSTGKLSHPQAHHASETVSASSAFREDEGIVSKVLSSFATPVIIMLEKV